MNPRSTGAERHRRSRRRQQVTEPRQPTTNPAHLLEQLARERDRAEAQAQEAQRRANELDAVFANIAEAVVVYDSRGVAVRVNHAAVKMFGFDPVGIDRGTRNQRIALTDPDGHPVSPEDLPTSRAERGETLTERMYRLTGSNGRRYLIRCSGRPLWMHGQLLGSVLSWHDVSEREGLLEQLRTERMHLEQRVQERTLELARQAAQLRALAAELTIAEQRERRRLAQALHDEHQQLLVAAKLRVEIFNRGKDAETQAACQDIADLLHEAIAHSRAITRDLSPPMLRTGGLVPALIWLAGWMRQKHQLDIEMHADPDAAPSAEELTILLYHSTRELLLNVVKHAQTSTATLRVTREDAQLRIEVADSGVGFDPALVQTDTAGTGFGLFSIRQRLALLGGRMEMASMPGQGSRFTLWAPLDRAPRAPEQASGGARQDAPRTAPPARADRTIRIVLVDDHTMVRQSLARLLGEAPDLEIVGEAADGKTALDLVEQIRPDVVLMDINMPVMNGIEATRALRAAYPAVCVIGLSMYEDSEQSQAMRNAGAAAYLTKSDISDNLLKSIRDAVSD